MIFYDSTTNMTFGYSDKSLEGTILGGVFASNKNYLYGNGYALYTGWHAYSSMNFGSNDSADSNSLLLHYSSSIGITPPGEEKMAWRDLSGRDYKIENLRTIGS